MKKDAKTMKEVAKLCDRFCSCSVDSCGCSNSTAEKNITCKNCTHYNTENVCDLDLYEKIVENHEL